MKYIVNVKGMDGESIQVIEPQHHVRAYVHPDHSVIDWLRQRAIRATLHGPYFHMFEIAQWPDPSLDRSAINVYFDAFHLVRFTNPADEIRYSRLLAEHFELGQCIGCIQRCVSYKLKIIERMRHRYARSEMVDPTIPVSAELECVRRDMLRHVEKLCGGLPGAHRASEVGER
jgi:hypothetical protein